MARRPHVGDRHGLHGGRRGERRAARRHGVDGAPDIGTTLLARPATTGCSARRRRLNRGRRRDEICTAVLAGRGSPRRRPCSAAKGTERQRQLGRDLVAGEDGDDTRMAEADDTCAAAARRTDLGRPGAGRAHRGEGADVFAFLAEHSRRRPAWRGRPDQDWRVGDRWTSARRAAPELPEAGQTAGDYDTPWSATAGSRARDLRLGRLHNGRRRRPGVLGARATAAPTSRCSAARRPRQIGGVRHL